MEKHAHNRADPMLIDEPDRAIFFHPQPDVVEACDQSLLKLRGDLVLISKRRIVPQRGGKDRR